MRDRVQMASGARIARLASAPLLLVSIVIAAALGVAFAGPPAGQDVFIPSCHSSGGERGGAEYGVQDAQTGCQVGDLRDL